MNIIKWPVEVGTRRCNAPSPTCTGSCLSERRHCDCRPDLDPIHEPPEPEREPMTGRDRALLGCIVLAVVFCWVGLIVSGVLL